MLKFTADALLDPKENITVQRNTFSGEQEVHTHGFLELVFLSEGSGRQIVDGRDYQVGRGALLFLNYGQTHAFRTAEPMTYYNILLKPEFLGEELIHSDNAFSLLSLTAFEDFRTLAGMDAFCTFAGRERLELDAIAAGMYSEFCRKELGYRTALRGYLSVLLAKLFRRMALPEPLEKRPNGLTPELLAYIEAHCCEKLGLSDLARRCFYNPSYFSRIFKEYSGKSLTDFIGEKRMERARELLAGTNGTVEEIAARTGYRDRGQFYRQFKACAGMTPKAFREKNKPIERMISMLQKQIEDYMDAHREELAEDVCRLVRIPSSRGEPLTGMPYGEGPANALAEALTLAQEMGFTVRNYENYVGTADLNDCPKELDILAHMDVVPVGDGWTVTEPFAPVVREGRIYGRGTADDKGPAVAALYAMKAVKDLKIPLRKNVRMILGTDEECGSSDLEHYYQQEKEAPKSFSPDADFPLINLEKGGLRGAFSASFPESCALPRIRSAQGGTKLNVVPDKAFAVVEGITAEELSPFCCRAGQETGISFAVSAAEDAVRIDAKGVGAHASTPEHGNNAITGLIKLLVSLPLAPCEGLTRLAAVEKTFPHGDSRGEAAGVAMSDELSGATTLSFDIFHYTPTELRGEFDCRASILANDENLRDVVDAHLAAGGVTLAPCAVFAPHHVPAESPFIQTLLRCYEQYTGEKGECLAIGGGTYVHHLENGVAFGCAKIGVDNHMHGDDEFAEIDQLVLSAKIFAQAIVEICG